MTSSKANVKGNLNLIFFTFSQRKKAFQLGWAVGYLTVISYCNKNVYAIAHVIAFQKSRKRHF